MRQLSFLFVLLSLHGYSALGQSKINHQAYNTEFGRLDVWIYNNQVTGSYEIAPKKIIGSFIAKLNGNVAKGRWTDPDGAGDIEFTFESDFTGLRIDYRSDNKPDLWYRDQWHGKLETVDDGKPCSSLSYGLIEPFIGTWEEFRLTENNSEEFIGTLDVKLTTGGCSLSQQFISQDSSFTYSTQAIVNPNSGFWEERYVFSTGTYADYQWIFDNGDIVQRKTGGSSKTDYLYQLRFTELKDSGYLLLQERSNDGVNWKISGRTRVKRKL